MIDDESVKVDSIQADSQVCEENNTPVMQVKKLSISDKNKLKLLKASMK